MEQTDLTIAGYDRIAPAFARKNFGIDLAAQYGRFLAMVPSAGPVLDLGCGPGRDTIYFEQAGRRATGLDLSAGMLAEARRRMPPGRFVQADMRAIPFAPGSFEAVWACASMLHLAKPEAAAVLAQIYQLLPPGGALFVAVKRGVDQNWRVDEESGSRFFFTYYLPSELWEMVAGQGFEVEGLAENLSLTRTEADGTPVRWINLYARRGKTV